MKPSVILRAAGPKNLLSPLDWKGRSFASLRMTR